MKDATLSEKGGWRRARMGVAHGIMKNTILKNFGFHRLLDCVLHSFGGILRVYGTLYFCVRNIKTARDVHQPDFFIFPILIIKQQC